MNTPYIVSIAGSSVLPSPVVVILITAGSSSGLVAEYASIVVTPA